VFYAKCRYAECSGAFPSKQYKGSVFNKSFKRTTHLTLPNIYIYIYIYKFVKSPSQKVVYILCACDVLLGGNVI
jgi:hypothetical protein